MSQALLRDARWTERTRTGVSSASRDASRPGQRGEHARQGSCPGAGRIFIALAESGAMIFRSGFTASSNRARSQRSAPETREDMFRSSGVPPGTLYSATSARERACVRVSRRSRDVRLGRRGGIHARDKQSTPQTPPEYILRFRRTRSLVAGHSSHLPPDPDGSPCRAQSRRYTSDLGERRGCTTVARRNPRQPEENSRGQRSVRLDPRYPSEHTPQQRPALGSHGACHDAEEVRALASFDRFGQDSASTHESAPAFTLKFSGRWFRPQDHADTVGVSTSRSGPRYMTGPMCTFVASGAPPGRATIGMERSRNHPEVLVATEISRTKDSLQLWSMSWLSSSRSMFDLRVSSPD